MVLTTASVAVLITDTVLSLWFVTYACRPSDVTATPPGIPPAIVLTTACVAVSITDTMLLLWSVTYARWPSGVTATPKRPFPVLPKVIVLTTCVAVSTTDTVPSCWFATYASWVIWANDGLAAPRHSPKRRPRRTAAFMTPTAAVPFADSGLPLPDCPAKSLTTSRFKDSRKTSTPTETQKSEYIWNQSVYMENIDH